MIFATPEGGVNGGGERVAMLSHAGLLKSGARFQAATQERRAPIPFDAVYSTSGDQLRAIPLIVKEVNEAPANVRSDPTHFQPVGDASPDCLFVHGAALCRLPPL
ncbi:hypothetical protein C7C56_000935 [Massilia glaciei]|uniref:Uncharacterized protein n=1 Tax=Massilia glaciei TaxID=1524097 RepID=A0A2U2I799_9BURK|nr:hypothetical protein C7C56_000935 [Massilia glaciei]